VAGNNPEELLAAARTDYGGVNVALVALAQNDEKLAEFIEVALSRLLPLRKTFRARHDVSIWRDLRLAGREDYRKHFATPGTSRPVVVNATRGKAAPSLVFPDVEAQLPVIVVRALDELVRYENYDFLQSIPFTTSRLFVDVVEPLGASQGTESSVMCFQLDGSTGLIHCFPVTEDEVRLRFGLPIPLQHHHSNALPLICFDNLQALSGDE